MTEVLFTPPQDTTVLAWADVYVGLIGFGVDRVGLDWVGFGPSCPAPAEGRVV